MYPLGQEVADAHPLPEAATASATATEPSFSWCPHVFVSVCVGQTFYALGIEAARLTMLNELRHVLFFDGGYINYRHMSMLVDVMVTTPTLLLGQDQYHFYS